MEVVKPVAEERYLLLPKGLRVSQWVVASTLVALDALIVCFIIALVPYTKIDWDAYMSQVDGFLKGERDYMRLEGDTGPLVYPAGFLYIFAALKYATEGLVFPAQVVFGVLYIINLAIVMLIYLKINVLPLWAFSLLCLSKRIHSIFVLRLFNDCFATTLLHSAIALLFYEHWYLGLIIFSAAVSVKMNVLLYAPPLFLLLLKRLSLKGVITSLLGAALVQLLSGLPFLLSHPVAYISRAYNLGRIFVHFWSVNFKFVPGDIFVSKTFAVFLLVGHLTLLGLFCHKKWCKHEGGLLCFLRSRIFPAISCKPDFQVLNKEHILTLMFVGNFIGIVCARSLHYQFYSWYFYSLPFLLWKTPFPTPFRLIIFATVELCWNIYPSTSLSSLLLLSAHLLILFGLWLSPSELPKASSSSADLKED
ncbi:asparagine-linked glycosylation 3 [Wolffia australiana]